MQALSWMQSISPIHPNRPALLRCYINRATLPSTASLGPPKAGDWCQQGILSHISFNLLQTHPEKHWHQHRGPQWALNGPAELHYPCATFSQPWTPVQECQKHPRSLKCHHKEGVPQKIALRKCAHTCGGNELPLSVNRVVAVRRGSTRRHW